MRTQSESKRITRQNARLSPSSFFFFFFFFFFSAKKALYEKTSEKTRHATKCVLLFYHRERFCDEREKEERDSLPKKVREREKK